MNRSRDIGTKAATAVAKYLTEHGHPYAERRALSGAKDKGDITGIPGIVIEVKAEKRFDLAGWLDEATLEAANANVNIGVVWFKKRGTTDPGKWYVLMDGATFVKLLEP